MFKIIKDIRETVKIPYDTSERMPSINKPVAAILNQSGFRLIGITDTTAGYSVDRLDAVFHEILYSCSGSGELVPAQGPPIEVRQGSALLLPAGLDYHYGTRRAPWRIAWCQLSQTPHWRIPQGRATHMTPAVCLKEVVQSIDNILGETFTQREGHARLMRLQIELLAMYLQREIGNTEPRKERKVRQQLTDLWQQVSSHLEMAWAVRELAARVNMSISTFHNTVVRISGCTPGQMLHRLRMTRAESLLCTSEYPIHVIAELLGYATPFSFSNAYKRHFGERPSETRTKARQVEHSESATV